MGSTWRRTSAGALALAAVAIMAACGGGEKKAPATTAATSAATTAGTAAATGATGGAAETTLTLVASNTLFDKAELKAPPGKVTIVVDNQDAGLPHNVHVFKGKDNGGESLGVSDLTTGPDKKQVTLTLAEGDYFFQCDAHPTTMAGKLEIA
jgi:plastocyanin